MTRGTDTNKNLVLRTISTSTIKDEVRRLADENNGIVTPEVLLERAADPDHVLHGAFEWNDTEAAHKYRLIQARVVIRACTIPVSRGSGASFTLRQFVNVHRGSGQYIDTRIVASNEDYRDRLLARALKDLEAFRKRYTEILEFFSGQLVDLEQAVRDKIQQAKRKDEI